MHGRRLQPGDRPRRVGEWRPAFTARRPSDGEERERLPRVLLGIFLVLLAAGVYPRFIAAIADVTRMRLNLPTLVTLGVVAIGALVAIEDPLLLVGVPIDLGAFDDLQGHLA